MYVHVCICIHKPKRWSLESELARGEKVDESFLHMWHIQPQHTPTKPSTINGVSVSLCVCVCVCACV